MLKLGSLFDGIGGFPYSAQRHGITPVWASEIEPPCVRVTKRHFPGMKHLGDITKINGAEIEPVDIITFGSPCQDLSVAGKRAGLDGERSGLFGEAIRIIDEMRSKTNAEYPRFAVWENVPGALSSSNGLDFKAVLQSFADCEIPMPDSGRWATAGMVRGGRCDIAWRVLDAQYWGVPQRRRRIFLVADFSGKCATEILFKPESLRGDSAPCGETRQETAGRAGNGAKMADAYACKTNQTGSNGLGISENVAYTLDSSIGQAVFDCRGNGDGKTVCTLTGDHQNRVTDYTAIVCAGFMAGQSEKAGGLGYQDEVSPTLKAPNSGTNQAPTVVYSRQCFDEFKENDVVSTQTARQRKDCTDLIVSTIDCRNHVENVNLSGTLQAKTNGGFSLNYVNPVKIGGIVRRLTVVECERLQGFPDNWTAHGHDNVTLSDTKRYEAIGNSVAVPCVDFVIQSIVGVANNKL